MESKKIDSKTRAYLRGFATKVSPSISIGKDGIGDNLLLQIENVLDAREIAKITILESADLDARKTLDELAVILHAEPVVAIGRKMVLYRYSKKCKNHILSNFLEAEKNKLKK